MQRTNVFIASSSEMHHERLEIVDLLTDMCSDTMKYVPVKWEYMDSAVHQEHKQAEYMLRLQKCEICIVMFWHSLGEYTEKELLLALDEQSKGNNLQRTYVLFKEDGEPQKPRLKEFKEKIVKQHSDIVYSFSNNYELRELTKELVYSADVKCKDDNWNGKEVKVMISADEELNEEKLEFTELIAHLNEVLESRGIRLRREKWIPHGADDFKQRLHECGMCLNLYWTKIPELADEEMKVAYNLSTNNTKSLNLYIFFKETSAEITAALADFKASFETVYGHFFCKFENVDTMNLHFILQFEACQNHLQSHEEKLVQIIGGKVTIGDKEFVNLKHVPFVFLNKEYQRLHKELLELDNQVAEARAKHIDNPDNEDLENDLFRLRTRRKELTEEFERYQTHLYDIALNFAKTAGENYSKQIIKARELFEKGDVVAADEILNIQEMKKEVKNDMNQYEQHRHNLELKIDAFRLKAHTVMGNHTLSISERFNIACEAYGEAIFIAKKLTLYKEKLANILFSYANLQSTFNKMYEAVELYTEALDIYRQLANTNPDYYMDSVVATQHNLAVQQNNLNRYNEAEENYLEVLQINRQLANTNPDVYLPRVARTLSNIAATQKELNRYNEAEKNSLEALRIYRQLAKSNPDAYMPNIAWALNNLATLHIDLHRYGEAEKNYLETLRIFRQLADANPDVYMSNVAMTLNNLATLQSRLNRYDEAEKNSLDALRIYHQLIDDNLDVYMPHIAWTLNKIADSQRDLHRYGEAEENYLEALRIYRQLANDNPDAYMSDVIRILTNLGRHQSSFNQYGKAEEYYLEALQISRQLADVNPNPNITYVAIILNDLALLLTDLHRYGEAKEYYLEALGISRQLADDNPDVYITNVAATLNNIAILLDDFNQYGEAEKYYLEASQIYHRLAMSNPGAYMPDVARILNNIGRLQSRINQYSKAEENYLEALRIYHQLADTNRKGYLPKIANTLLNFACLKGKQKKTEEEREILVEALDTYERLEQYSEGAYADKISQIKGYIKDLDR